MSLRSWSYRADRWMRRHKVVTAAAAIGALWYFVLRTPASAQPPAPSPQPPLPPLPPPAPPSPPNPSKVVHHLPLIPGDLTMAVTDGDTILLQLPFGASWSGSPPLALTPDSVLGGGFDPQVPTGSEVVTWTDVTGNGTLEAVWTDAQGNAWTSMIHVTAAGGAHTL